MTLASLNRWKAFGLHLALSALIAATVFGLVMWVWYPAPYFAAMGGAVLLRLLIGVDVVLGPLITLIIFDPAKPSLKFDLGVIAALQLAALVYGGYVMFEARPVYNVFVGDRFATVAANAIDEGSLSRAAETYRRLPLDGPRVVAARLPQDPKELADLVTGLTGDLDVPDLPHLYVPYADAAAAAAKSAKPLVALARISRENSEAVDAFVTAHGRDRILGYVPVKARNQDFSAVVDRKTGEIVGYLPLNPW